MTGATRPLPSWVLNLLGFGILIALVLVVFFWQLLDMDRELQRNTQARSATMAAIIEENLANAELSTTTIDALTTTFLRDKARFIEYLHAIDPMQTDELTALARETGLRGISVLTASGLVSGPEQWFEQPPTCQQPADRLRFDPTRQTALLTYAGTTAGIDCIVVGLDATSILELRDKTALPVLLANLSRLPGIHYVRMDEDQPWHGQAQVHLITTASSTTVEAQQVTSRGVLVIGLDASGHVQRLHQLQQHFLLFATLLLGLGLFFSWLFHRAQQHDMDRTRRFERLLAKEHEAAALGRATATIAHELRNPLNALGMGLQRFKLESPNLNEEQQHLLAAMHEAVQRSGGIITELQRFTRPITPRCQMIDPQALLERMLALYRPAAEEQGIALHLANSGNGPLDTDAELVAEVLENLLRNSIEAQPEGGFLSIDSDLTPAGWQLSLSNGGYHLSIEDSKRLGEPYFTSKTRGTGLGLARCRNIVEALGGELQLHADHQQHQLRLYLHLPPCVDNVSDTSPNQPKEERA